MEVMHTRYCTANDVTFLQSVPITLPVTAEEHEKLQGADRIVLRYKDTQEVLAVIRGPQFFTNRKEEICSRIFGTLSANHPKVEKILA